MGRFSPGQNQTFGPTIASGSSHQMTGSVTITGSLSVNGVAITGGGGGGGGIAMDGSTANGVLTRLNSTTASVEANFRFDGSRFDATGSSFLSGNLTQGGGEGLNSDFYEGSGQVALSYAGENLDDPDAGSQYHFFIDKGADNDLPEINIGTIDGEQRPGDGSSTINIGTSGSSVTINGGEAATGANPITIGNDYSAVVVGQLTGTSVYIPGNTVGVTGPAQLHIGSVDDGNLGKITLIDGNNTTGSAIIWNSSGSEGLILSSSRAVTIYPGINPQGSAANSIQIGNNNGAVAVGSLNISFGGTVLGQGSTAIGPGSPQAIAAGASAIGSGSHSTATNALAVGTTSVASAAAAVALGSSATGSAANAIAVGTTTKATAAGATALGNAATASAAGAIAIGSGATTAGAYSVVLGDTITNVTHNHTTVIGSRAGVGGANAIAIGSGSNASAANAIAIGQSAAPSAADTIAIGQGAAPSATGSVAIGAGSTTTGQQSVVLGPTNSSTAHYTTIVGYNNNASVNYSIIIGDTSVASAANAVAVGQKVLASGADSIAIGQFATASAANSLAFGSGSVANEANTVVFGNATQPVRLFVSGAMASTSFTDSISAATNASCSFYNIFDYTLGGTLTLTALNPVAGASYLFFFRQDGTGSRVVSFSGFKWPGGTAPTLSTAASSIDIVSGISDGTYIYADTTKDFS